MYRIRRLDASIKVVDVMSWRDVDYRLETIVSPDLDCVIDSMNATYANGGMLLRCFRPTTTLQPDVRSDEELIRHLLESEAVRRLVPELEITIPIEPFPEFTSYGRYELEGAITSRLLSNGAYVKSKLDPSTARMMAWKFVDAMLGDELARVFRVDGTWAEWFVCTCWSISFVVIDDRRSRWWLVCITDTD